MTRVTTVRMYNDVLTWAIEYIEETSGNCSLDDFCHQRSVSRRSVQRALHYHGTSWVQLQASQRKIKAADMLLSGKSIKEVAFAIGYKNNSHFCQAFKGWYGMTPAQYRDGYRIAA